MKTSTLKTVSILASAFALSLISAAASAACETGGNQCGVDTTTAPAINWGANAGVKLGGDSFTLGKGLSAADGNGQKKDSKAWTYSEGMAGIETKTSLKADNIAGCTSCGDNQVQFLLTGNQKTVAGAANESFSTNGPAVQSISESGSAAKLGAFAWGQMGGTLNIK